MNLSLGDVRLLAGTSLNETGRRRAGDLEDEECALDDLLWGWSCFGLCSRCSCGNLMICKNALQAFKDSSFLTQISLCIQPGISLLLGQMLLMITIFDNKWNHGLI
jgi:hypothetical protein